MRKYLLLLISLFICAQLLTAEEADDTPVSDAEEDEFAPEDMELVIPTILLEVEEEKLALIEAPLPGDEERTLSDLVLSLPDAPELEVSPLDVDNPGFLDISSIVTGIDPGDMDENGEQKYFYSTGLIGGGTGNRILGDITLYKLGPSPRFQLQFFHEGRDGFAGYKAGEGYSLRNEKLSGNLEVENDAFTLETDVEYNEEERGLQGNDLYSSMTLRNYSIDSVFNTGFSHGLGLNCSLYFSSADQRLAGTEPPGYYGMTFNPDAGVAWQNDIFDLELSAGYQWENNGISDGDREILHSFDGIFTGTIGFSGGFDITAGGGVLWIPGESPEYPCSIEIEGESEKIFLFTRVERIAEQVAMLDIWKLYPWIKPDSGTGEIEDFSPVLGWKGNFYSRWNPVSFLSFEFETEYTYLENGFLPTAVGSDGLSASERGESSALFTGISAGIGFPGSVSFKTGWKGQVFEKEDPLLPLHSITGELSWSPGVDAYGASILCELDIWDEENPVYETQWIPKLGFSGYMGITRGIRLVLEGEDLLSPLLETGRFIWDNYLDTGFALTLKLGISL